MYQLVIVPPSTEPTGVWKDQRMYVPFTAANKDYQEYLEWVAEGNTPEPADSE